MKRPSVSGNGREYCPYYDAEKTACGIKTADDNGTGGRPSRILADCRKHGKEERMCAYQKRLSLLPEQKIDELIDGLIHNVYPVVKEVHEALNRPGGREKSKGN